MSDPVSRLDYFAAHAPEQIPAGFPSFPSNMGRLFQWRVYFAQEMVKRLGPQPKSEDLATNIVEDILINGLHGDDYDAFHEDARECWEAACDLWGPDGTVDKVVRSAAETFAPELRRRFEAMAIQEPLSAITRTLLEKILKKVDWYQLAETWITDIRMTPPDDH